MRRLSMLVATATLVALPVLEQPGGSPSASPSLTPVTWERLLNAADDPENWLMVFNESYIHSKLTIFFYKFLCTIQRID